MLTADAAILIILWLSLAKNAEIIETYVGAVIGTACEGDLLVMYAAGAYGYSMASNYNRAGRPEVVFAKNGKARRVLRRETYEDQLRLEADDELI